MKKNYDFRNATRGAVLPVPTGKTRITIRIDDDVLEWFRRGVHEAGGGSYQTSMNLALREYMQSNREPLESTLRRVLLEVVPGAKPRRRNPVRSQKSKKAPRIRQG